VIAIIGTILGWILLPETLNATQKKANESKKQELINVSLLWNALTKSAAGPVLLVTFLSMTSHQALVLGFQSFTVDVLHLGTASTGLLFASIGLASILMQAVGIRWLLSRFTSKTLILKGSLIASAIFCLLLFGANSAWYFVLVTIVYVCAFAPQNVVLTGLLSQQTKAEDQGGMMGIQQAYLSLGQIIGPTLAGLVTNWSINSVFIMAAAFFMVSLVASNKLTDPRRASVDI
jgi:predicted MFS family arabinose efflux permease